MDRETICLYNVIFVVSTIRLQHYSEARHLPVTQTSSEQDSFFLSWVPTRATHLGILIYCKYCQQYIN